MNNYAINEDEFTELERTMRLVDLFATVVQSESRVDVTQCQLSAFTSTVFEPLFAIFKSIEARYQLTKGVSKVEGLAPYDIGQLIELLSGKRFTRISGWRAIESKLERCAEIDESMSYALGAWREVIEGEMLNQIKGDPQLRFSHIVVAPEETERQHRVKREQRPLKRKAQGREVAQGRV